MNSSEPRIKKILLSTEQIQKRVAEIARQVNADYAGKPLHVVGVLGNAFIFMSDLVRHLEMPVACSFLHTESRQLIQDGSATTEIFFTPEADVTGDNVLIVETLVQSGVTSEFLIRNLISRGAASVKLATLLDKQSERCVMLHPDYFGFLLDETFVVGYGLGAPEVGRNLPYVASLAHS